MHRTTSAASDYLRIAHTVFLSLYLSSSSSSSLSPYNLFPLPFTLPLSLPSRHVLSRSVFHCFSLFFFSLFCLSTCLSVSCPFLPPSSFHHFLHYITLSPTTLTHSQFNRISYCRNRGVSHG